MSFGNIILILICILAIVFVVIKFIIVAQEKPKESKEPESKETESVKLTTEQITEDFVQKSGMNAIEKHFSTLKHIFNCPICNNSKLSFNGFEISRPFNPLDHSSYSGKCLPKVIFLCGNCGFVREFAWLIIFPKPGIQHRQPVDYFVKNEDNGEEDDDECEAEDFEDPCSDPEL